MPLALHQMKDLLGATIIDIDGDKVGKVADLYLDRETRTPTFVATHTGLFNKRRSYVPIEDAKIEEGMLRLNFDVDRVKNAPEIDSVEHLSEDEEARLYSYYGVNAPRGAHVEV